MENRMDENVKATILVQRNDGKNQPKYLLIRQMWQSRQRSNLPLDGTLACEKHHNPNDKHVQVQLNVKAVSDFPSLLFAQVMCVFAVSGHQENKMYRADRKSVV